jgi:hypothetical protein
VAAPSPDPPVDEAPPSRPRGVAAVSGFFLASAFLGLAACLSLAFPGGPLQPMWRLNPGAQAAFGTMGASAVWLLAAVSLACTLSAVGLWRGARWGWRLALCVLGANLVGTLASATLGQQPRAALGLPLAGAVVGYLCTQRVRRFFAVRRRP